MGRIKGREAIKAYVKKYGSNGVDFFTLKDDGDTATVRFLHTDDQDLELILVHKVEIDGKEKWVECLEDGCPFCANENIGRPTLKLFMILVDHEDDKIKCWERGASMVDFFLGYIDKYGHLNNRDYEIVRHGKKGSNKTQYQLFPCDPGPLEEFKFDKNGKIIERKPVDMPERPNVYGRFVLQMTAEQMEEYLSENTPQPRDRRGSGGKKEVGF
jgi:hypothetical protein